MEGYTVQEGARSLAKSATEREIVQSFLEGRVTHDGETVGLGDTDLAVVELCLCAVQEGRDLLLTNPFHYSLIPALVCVEYWTSTQRSLPSRLNDGAPMFLLPKAGYIGDIESFRYQHQTARASIVDKQNVSSPDELHKQHCIYRATSSNALATTADPIEFGMVFVDLRATDWKQSVVDLEAFAAHHDVESFVFYADTRDFATDMVRELVDDVVEISRGFVASSDPSDPFSTGTPTRARVQESILAEEIGVKCVRINDEQIVEWFNDLYSRWKSISSHVEDGGLALGVFDKLASLASSPTIYDEAARSNYITTPTDELLSALKRTAKQRSGVERNLLYNFYKRARDLRAELEEANPKRNVFIDVIERASGSTDDVVVVASNQASETALQRTLYDDSVPVPDNLSTTTRSNVVPRPETTYLFLGPLPYGSPLYEFPPSNDLIFLAYPFETGLIRTSLTESEYDSHSDTDASDGPDDEQLSRVTVEVIDVYGDAETIDFDLDEFEEDVAQSVFRRSDTSRTGQSTTETTSVDGGEGEIEVSFQEESTHVYRGSERVTVFDPSRNQVKHKFARELLQGEYIVSVDSAASDVYDHLVDHERERTLVEQNRELVEKWRDILVEGVEEEGYDSDDLLDELQDRGSDIQTIQAVDLWMSGDTIGPGNPEDVRRVLAMFRPEFVSLASSIFDSMEYLRQQHRRWGRLVRQLLEAEVDPTKSTQVPENLRRKIKESASGIRLLKVNNVGPSGS